MTSGSGKSFAEALAQEMSLREFGLSLANLPQVMLSHQAPRHTFCFGTVLLSLTLIISTLSEKEAFGLGTRFSGLS